MTALSVRPSRPAGSVRTAGRLGWLVAWAVHLPFFVVVAGRLNESDTFWEIRTGLWMLEHGRLPAVDPFSWTVAGRSWTLNSWGFDLLLGWLYRAGGLVLVAWASAALAAAAVALALALARRHGASAAAAGTVSWGVVALILPWFSARPQLVDYIAVPVVLLLLGRIIETRRPVAWTAALGATVVLWADLHSTALLATGLAGGTALVSALVPRLRSRAGRAVVAAGTSALAAMLTPYGIAVLGHVGEVRTASASVAEWRPIDLADPVQLALTIAALAALVLCAWKRTVVPGVAIALLLAASAVAVRNLPVLALVLVAPLAAAGSPTASWLLARHRRLLAVSASVAVAATAIVAAVRLPLVGVPRPEQYPAALLAALPAGNLANDYLQGGWVILNRPDVRVSLDSRNDLYGARLVADLDREMRGEGDLGLIEDSDAVLTSEAGRLATRLEELGWIARAADSGFVVLVPPRSAVSS